MRLIGVIPRKDVSVGIESGKIAESLNGDNGAGDGIVI